MTENQFDALVNDRIFSAKSALYHLDLQVKREFAALELLEAKGVVQSPTALPGVAQAAIQASVELRLLVQLRRQAGRAAVVDDSEQHDGSDY